jgi:hypothetical protein
MVSSHQETIMPLLLLLHPGTRQRRLAWWLCATGVALAGLLAVCILWSGHSLALLADRARVQHQVDAIRLALANVRGALAPDSSCQPACRSILLDAVKRAMPGMRAAWHAWTGTWP